MEKCVSMKHYPLKNRVQEKEYKETKNKQNYTLKKLTPIASTRIVEDI